MPDAPIASVPDLMDVATAVLEESGFEELDPATAVDVLPSTLPAVPAQTTAVEPVPAGAVAAPPPAPAAEAPVEAARAAIPTPDAPPSGAVSQTAPGNVNVSVRVDSPGDDGAVEQVNAAVAETAAQYQPESTQYQEPIPSPDAQQAALTSQPAASEPAAEAVGWNWTWEWDCSDAASEIPVPADVGVENWNWDWNWNCGEPDSATTNSAGEKPPQYQPAVTQYRPININISIRINSPGNNGPVLQTNVAVAVTPPALPQLRVESATPSANQPQAASAVAEATTPLGALVAVFGELLVDDPEAVPAEDGCCPLREPSDPATAAPEPESMLLPEAPRPAEQELTPQGRFRASVAVTLRLARASEAVARSARPAPKPAQLRPAPHTSAPAHERAAALSAAGLAPLNAPDSRFGQLAFLVVAFAFAIAFADASRSVAAEVRARGEDPDPPPTRPG